MSQTLILLLSFCIVPLISPLSFQPCTLSTGKPGADIADNASLFPDPFVWYTNPSYPGVTLPGPQLKSKCNWSVGGVFQWTTSENTCVLNGQGYPLEGTPNCNNGLYAVSQADFQRLATEFVGYSRNKAKEVKNNDGSTAYVGQFNYQGQELQAAMSIGHGVLNGLCGNCFLIKFQDKLVFQLQTDVRAWSLELSGGANVWISEDNYGGTCHIPEVMEVDCDEMLNSMH